MHGVAYIHIEGDETTIECLCGWRSKDHQSETDARVEYDKHEEKE